MTTDRRRFLRLLAGGTALCSTPAFMSACATMPGSSPAEPLPANPFLDWFSIDERRCASLMSVLSANGADWAELYFQHRRQVVLSLRDGELAEPQIEVIQGVGMRVLRDGESSFAFTEDLTPESMRATALIAAGAGAEASAARAGRFVVREPGRLYLTDQHWSDVGIPERVAILEQVDALARAADPRIDSTHVRCSDSDERIMIATLDGRIETDRRPMTRLSAQLTASAAGLRVSGFANTAARDGLSWYTAPRRQALVDSAVERTVLQFDARQPPSGNMPVVFAAGSSGIVLHEVIGHSLEADFANSGQSVYSGRLGESIASDAVTIIDQPGIPYARGAMNIDDEGSPGQRNVLIENGVLRNFLHDRRTAKASGTTTTGSARRDSFRHEPMPRMTCTWLADGPHSAADIIGAVDRGIVAETYGSSQVETTDGEFSFVVRNGWLIENGERSMPIRDVSLRGNAAELLQNISMVGNDGRFDSGGWTCGKRGQRVPVSQGMPTTLVADLEVANRQT